jgi:hypothetical protein
MREFILGNDHISKIIRECVDKYINEELGIANDVLIKTNEIKELIYGDSRNAEKEKLDDGVSMTNGLVVLDIFGTSMKVIYTIYNFRDFDTYYDKKEYFNPKSSMSYEKNEIYVSILSISGEFQENSFGDSIQHELEHLYQIKKQGKGLFQDNNLYEKAITNINNELYNGWIGKLANVIYYSRNEEHDAFVNGLYQQLVNLDTLADFDYVIKTSTPYKISMLLFDLKRQIEDTVDDESFNLALKFFKRPKRWFMAQCEIGIRKIIKKIMRVRMKAKNDFLKVNEGIILEFKFNGMDEEIVNRRVDNYYKKLKGSN